MTRKLLSLLAAIALLSVFGCSSVQTTTGEPAAESTQAQDAAAPAAAEAEPEEAAVTSEPETTEAPGEFTVTSAGIAGGVMDDAFGMRGTQVDGFIPTRSLPLALENAPEGTACLALSMIDPDGGDWVHWLAVNIPVGDIAENASVDLAGTFVQGKNDFGSVGYGGPTPPSGVHTYVITVYALSAPVALDEGFSLDAFTQAIEGNVLASVELTGTYAS